MRSQLTPPTRTAPLVVFATKRPQPCSRLRRSHVRAGEPSSDEAAQGCALRAALPAACSPTAAQSPPAPVLADLNKHPVEGFSAGLVDEGNVFEWEIMIMGPPDTH